MVDQASKDRMGNTMKIILKSNVVEPPLEQIVEIGVYPPQTNGLPYRIIVKRDGETVKEKVMHFELSPECTLSQYEIPGFIRGSWWTRNDTIYSGGSSGLWLNTSTQNQLNTSGNRVAMNSAGIDLQAENLLLHYLGMETSVSSLNLYLDGLAFLLPSTRAFIYADETAIMRLQDEVLPRMDLVVRGWDFFCQMCLEIDNCAMRCALEDYSIGGISDIFVALNGSVFGREIQVLYEKINEYIISGKVLTFSERLDILIKLAGIGQKVGPGVYFNQTITKDRATFDSLFDDTVTLPGQRKSFAGEDSRIVVQTLIKAREYVRSDGVFKGFARPNQILRRLGQIPTS